MMNRENTASSMQANSNIGVLSDTELLLIETVQEKRVLRSLMLPLDVSEPDGLLEYLWDAGLHSVWVMPATRFSRTITCAWLERANKRWIVVVHADPREPTRPIRALLWPKGSSQWEARRLALVLPEYAGWDWTLADARGLLATVGYLEQALARPVIDSPELVAHELLTELTRDTPISSFRASSVDLYSLAGSDGTPVPFGESARDLVWMRPLTRVEQRQRYLHKYIHLSFSLQAALTAQLGEGAPQFSANGRAYDGIRPGIWRISAELAGSVFDGKGLPSCLDGEWMSTPQVKRCQDIGYRVQVREGWYWQESAPLLKRWASTLWQGASRLHMHPQVYRHAQGRANAAHSIARLAQLGVSILGQEQTAGGWSRPDWWAQVIGGGRAVLFTQLVNLVRKGRMPVLVDKEALWVISDESSPLAALPGLVTASKWSGYTVGYEAPLLLSGEVREAFSKTQHAGELALALDALAGEALS